MLEKISSWSLKNWLAVLFFSIIICVIGAYSLSSLTIEAFPDPTDPQIQVITSYDGQPTEEVERQITLPLERALNGLPNLVRMRSINIFGLSNITCTFSDNVDLILARQQVLEKLRDADLPDGIIPSLAPNATPIGEVYRYVLEGAKGDVRKLRRIQDWYVRPKFLRVAGVADVVTFGGLDEEIHVNPSPTKMAVFGVTLADIETAVKKSSKNASGGTLQKGSEGFVISSNGLFHSIEDIENIGISESKGTPILLKDVASVNFKWAPRQGVASHGNKWDIVEGTILMRRGENPSIVLEKIREEITKLNKGLPDGAHIKPFYDRTELVDQTLDTVIHNLIEGALLVILVLWIFLADLKASLIVASVIPISLLISFTYLYSRGMSANLLSMGAVDFGVIVDAGVVIIETILRKLQSPETKPENLSQSIQSAIASVIKPTVFSICIIIAAYLPIFLLQRVEGRIFAPMAHTVISALLGALILSITLVPVLSLIIYRRKLPKHKEPFVLRVCEAVYKKALSFSLKNKFITIIGTLLVFAGAVSVVPGLGSEFLPSINEGSLYITFTLPQNISLNEARKLIPGIYSKIATHPVVKDIIFQIGRPEDGTDPNLPNNLEAFVRLKKPKEWPKKFKNVDDIVDDISPKIDEIPGMDVTYSQPIADNVNDSLSGQPGDIAVKIYGDDLTKLQDIAENWKSVIANVRGVADLGLVRSGMQPQMQIIPQRALMARYNVDMEDLQHTIDSALGGIKLGQLWDGEIPIPISLRLPESSKNDAEKIKRLMIPTNQKTQLPLLSVANVKNGYGRLSIFRENGKRYIGLRMDVRNRDMGSFVTEAKEKVSRDFPLPEGVTAEWGGSFESKERAMNRLIQVLPISLVLTVILLFASFGSIIPALVVLLSIPLALIGGIFGLFVMKLPLSIAAAVGFIALIGQASLNGVLILSSIRELHQQGENLFDSVYQGSINRLRPVLMTGTLAALGLLPASLSREMGAETQQPLAVVVVGGTISAMLLTLIVLPVLYYIVVKSLEKIRRKEKVLNIDF